MTDALLLLHLLSAAALVTGTVAFSAAVLGAQLPPRAVRPFVAVWQVGMVGVLLFGVALAIDIDTYDPWDAWILIAIVLWLGAGRTADLVTAVYTDRGGATASVAPGIARTHWVHVVLVVLLLADMVWKPWA